jgi:hypothetical protein
MNQVRSVLAVAAAALALAACEGAGSITDPTFRDSKAAPRTTAGSGFHTDIGGWVGSGYDVTTCTSNTGTLGSGYDATSGCASAENGGTYGSGNRIAPSATPSKAGGLHTPISRPGPRGAEPSPQNGGQADCVPPSTESGGWIGSGYNYCPS